MTSCPVHAVRAQRLNSVSGTSADVPSMTVMHDGLKPEGSIQPLIKGFVFLDDVYIFSPRIEVCFKCIIGRAKSGVKVLILRDGIVLGYAVTVFDIINCIKELYI